MTDREVMQQALTALEWFIENDDTNIGQEGNQFWEEGLNKGIAAADVIKLAIAQPEQPAEPVAWMTQDGRVANNATKQTAMSSSSKLVFNIPLYMRDPLAAIAQPTIKESLTVQTIAQPEQQADLEKVARDAITSLETISRLAGVDDYMQTIAEVRGYASSRAIAAKQEIATIAQPKDKP